MNAEGLKPRPPAVAKPKPKSKDKARTPLIRFLPPAGCKSQGLIIADCSNRRILHWRIGAPSGTMVAGTITRGKDQYSIGQAKCFSLDHEGTVFVADRGNQRLVSWPLKAAQAAQQLKLISDMLTQHRLEQKAMIGRMSLSSDRGLVEIDDDDDDSTASEDSGSVIRRRSRSTRKKKPSNQKKTGRNLTMRSVQQMPEVPENSFHLSRSPTQSPRIDRSSTASSSVLTGSRLQDKGRQRTMSASEDAELTERIVQQLKQEAEEDLKNHVVVMPQQVEGGRLGHLGGPHAIQINFPYVYAAFWSKHCIVKYHRQRGAGTVVAGGHGAGDGLHQLNCPQGFILDQDGGIIIADTRNHRIVWWARNAEEGVVIAGGNGRGSGNHQFDRPSALASDRDGGLYVSDSGNHRVMMWKLGAESGQIMAGGNGQGNGMDQLDEPLGILVDHERTALFVADSGNHRITKWNIGGTKGVVVAGGQGAGGDLDQLDVPVWIGFDTIVRGMPSEESLRATIDRAKKPYKQKPPKKTPKPPAGSISQGSFKRGNQFGSTASVASVAYALMASRRSLVTSSPESTSVGSDCPDSPDSFSSKAWSSPDSATSVSTIPRSGTRTSMAMSSVSSLAAGKADMPESMADDVSLWRSAPSPKPPAKAPADEKSEAVQQKYTKMKVSAEGLPLCPDCEEDMAWNEPDAARYGNGWICHNFRFCAGSDQRYKQTRWVCKTCKNDVCKLCHPYDPAKAPDADSASQCDATPRGSRRLSRGGVDIREATEKVVARRSPNKRLTSRLATKSTLSFSILAVDKVARLTSQQIAWAWENVKKTCRKEHRLVWHFTSRHALGQIQESPGIMRGARGGVSVTPMSPAELNWDKWGEGQWRRTVGETLWGDEWEAVQIGGADAAKLEIGIILEVRDFIGSSKNGRSSPPTIIIDKKDLTLEDGRYYLPSKHIKQMWDFRPDDAERHADEQEQVALTIRELKIKVPARDTMKEIGPTRHSEHGNFANKLRDLVSRSNSPEALVISSALGHTGGNAKQERSVRISDAISGG